MLSALGHDAREYFSEYGGVTNEALAGLIGDEANTKVGIDTPSEATLEEYPNAKPRNKVRRFAS